MINLPCTFSKLQTYLVPSLFYSATINLTCAFLNDKLTLYLSSLQYNNLASTFSKWQTYLIPFLFYNFKLNSLIACEINISKRVRRHATRELLRHVSFLLSLFWLTILWTARNTWQQCCRALHSFSTIEAKRCHLVLIRSQCELSRAIDLKQQKLKGC